MGQVEQNVANRYLKKASLQRLLERLFPGQTEFNIEMRDDVWHFKAPKEVDSDWVGRRFRSEAAYTLRYPEFKPESNKWVIRQTGVYHRTNFKTSQNLCILFNPMPGAKANQKAQEWLFDHSRNSDFDPVWLHRVLHETYLPSWRSYIAHFERQFLPMVRASQTSQKNQLVLTTKDADLSQALTTFATFIEEPSTQTSSHLTTLARLENRFLQIPAILSSSEDVLQELSELCKVRQNDKTQAAASPSSVDFENFRRQCGAFSRTASYLHQRAQTTAQLLANTLSFREQLDTRKQNENMLNLNKSVVFITTLTLLYLPPSFIATFFGMNFFDLDDENNRIVSTSMIWIYVVASVILTAATFIIYHMLLEGGPFGKRKMVLPKAGEWNQLKIWVRKRSTFAEKNGLSV
ncbi:hypothetical protein K4K49_013253 [Colletotrichum sp. SAR 10_70]|nr:hypothetical protein K4K50_000975 [Colletotrichum sp. SAR 10_71]KAI8183296.1 hypothetical protein K4K51_000330 [Colletotrichum sp. SAR 10_75]KAI8186199.1 hypothetical protein K4K49_013253 [Colletotrichum sp. SAR 10_70]KAI8193278.1 hypothetical protein KHU50_012635 [Colletotrichum sp. SAR 10_65]KAJ5002717.1 hypothetical protein K4K48_013080 [Colletotrichum sp. SAR 10_66]